MVTWLDELPKKARAKCLARIERLAEFGHELRRPEADFLRDGVYELRISLAGIQYRILYFFFGRAVVVLSHGVIKRRVVPPRDIDLAVKHIDQFEQDPAQHTHQEPIDE